MPPLARSRPRTAIPARRLLQFPMEKLLLVSADLSISFMWVWAGALTKLFVYQVLGLGHHPGGELVKGALYLCVLFFFAWLGKASRGGSYNPLSVLARSISGDWDGFFFTIAARIPAQVVGSVVGVMVITLIFPKVAYGPRLKVDMNRGALTEGALTFAIVAVSLGLTKYDPRNFFLKTWIHSVSKLALQILGSDLTGGIMNPASATGWALVLGNQSGKELLFVYWLAPLEATLLAVWTFRLLSSPPKKTPQFMVSVPRRVDSSSRILSTKTKKTE
ncbi:probable aquaporin SIP2-1 isoform X2 [Nymphaea colorata]|nr:probable aquaporin SIP2-1 isoform X2 [Nymphaea colorata]